MGKRIIPTIGQKYGHLTIIADLGTRDRRTCVQVKCDCGTVKDLALQQIKGGNTSSCGCKWKSSIGEASRTHGRSSTRTYHTWKRMRARCSNSALPDFAYYGGRGISVCERWQSFELFLADMGECPERMTIDRQDNNGNYSPDNCKWATRKEQAINRRTVRLITLNGETHTLTDWAKQIGITPSNLHFRLKRWPIEQALTLPPNTFLHTARVNHFLAPH